MNNFIFAEFLVEFSEYVQLENKLSMLGKDFETIDIVSEYDTGEDVEVLMRVSGRMNSETASAIKLSDLFLSKRMRVSCISDELKNQFRQ